MEVEWGRRTTQSSPNLTAQIRQESSADAPARRLRLRSRGRRRGRDRAAPLPREGAECVGLRGRSAPVLAGMSEVGQSVGAGARGQRGAGSTPSRLSSPSAGTTLRGSPCQGPPHYPRPRVDAHPRPDPGGTGASAPAPGGTPTASPATSAAPHERMDPHVRRPAWLPAAAPTPAARIARWASSTSVRGGRGPSA